MGNEPHVALVPKMNAHQTLDAIPSYNGAGNRSNRLPMAGGFAHSHLRKGQFTIIAEDHGSVQQLRSTAKTYIPTNYASTSKRHVNKVSYTHEEQPQSCATLIKPSRCSRLRRRAYLRRLNSSIGLQHASWIHTEPSAVQLYVDWVVQCYSGGRSRFTACDRG